MFDALQIARGSTVYYHYSFWLEHCDEPFDCSRLRGKIEKTVLAKEERPELSVIEGMDIALASMRLHETARFLIRHEYAYGKRGQRGKIMFNVTVKVILSKFGIHLDAVTAFMLC